MNTIDIENKSQQQAILNNFHQEWVGNSYTLKFKKSLEIDKQRFLAEAMQLAQITPLNHELIVNKLIQAATIDRTLVKYVNSPIKLD